MISFIIYDKEKEKINEYKNLIDKILIKNNYEYKIYNFQKYDKLAISKSEFKIYIIDIDITGVEILKEIRENQDDWVSMIIIVTRNIKEKYSIYNKRMLIVDYINKQDKYLSLLKECILISLKNYNNRPKQIKFSYKKIDYNINYDEIYYIEKEQDSKLCKIKTDKQFYYVQSTINSIKNKLDNRFILGSRASLINKDKIESYNYKDNIIIFKNKEKYYCVSKKQKKEFLNDVRSNI